jgi:hypothetical protein
MKSSSRRSQIVTPTSQLLEKLLAIDCFTAFQLRKATTDLAVDFLTRVFLAEFPGNQKVL